MESDQVCHHFKKDQCIQAKVGQTNQQKKKKATNNKTNNCTKYISLFTLVVTRSLQVEVMSTCKNMGLTLQKVMCKRENSKAMFQTADRTSFMKLSLTTEEIVSRKSIISQFIIPRNLNQR